MNLMKTLALGALVALDLAACSSPEDALGTPQTPLTTIGPQDFLRASGTALRNHSGRGSVVNLRGTNAGGWLIQEAWMNPTDAPDQLTARSVLAARFGAATRDELLAVYEDNYWTEQDFLNCRSLGMNVLRLPFGWFNLLDDAGSLRPGAWARLDWFVGRAQANGLYVILDLHGAPGSQNGADHSGDTSGAHLWTSSANQDKTVWLWEQVAAHFAGNPAVAGYDLLNEPTAGPKGPTGGLTASIQWEFYDRLYHAVRAVDPDHVLFLEACWDPAQMPNPADRKWTNVVYEYHNYCWGNDNNDAAQNTFTAGKLAAVRAANYGVPTLVGEFTGFTAWNAWEQTLAKYNAEGWNWTTWSYKVTGTNNSWGLYNHNPPTVHIQTDTAADIRAKWRQVGTSTRYAAVADLVAKYAAGPVFK